MASALTRRGGTCGGYPPRDRGEPPSRLTHTWPMCTQSSLLSGVSGFLCFVLFFKLHICETRTVSPTWQSRCGDQGGGGSAQHTGGLEKAAPAVLATRSEEHRAPSLSCDPRGGARTMVPGFRKADQVPAGSQSGPKDTPGSHAGCTAPTPGSPLDSPENWKRHALNRKLRQLLAPGATCMRHHGARGPSRPTRTGRLLTAWFWPHKEPARQGQASARARPRSWPAAPGGETATFLSAHTKPGSHPPGLRLPTKRSPVMYQLADGAHSVGVQLHPELPLRFVSAAALRGRAAVGIHSQRTNFQRIQGIRQSCVSTGGGRHPDTLTSARCSCITRLRLPGGTQLFKMH